jgi:hypothetical protein
MYFHISFIFDLNVVLKLNFLKMAPVRVRFSPGFLLGGGFSAEHFAFDIFFYILVNSTAE